MHKQVPSAPEARKLVFQTVVLLLHLMIPLPGQQANLNFKHLTIENGLSQNAVYAILQDRRGFMWFGTKDGLNKYDGYTMTVYMSDPADSSSISNNSIKRLFEDSRGNLWIGTFDGGLNRMERDRETFHHFLFDPLNPHSLSGNHVTAIAEDSLGNLWVGTFNDGLNLLSREEMTTSAPSLKRFIHDPANPASLSRDNVHDLLIDRQGMLWIGTGAGLNQLVDANMGRFQQYPITVKAPNTPSRPGDAAVNSIYLDQNDSLWIGTTFGIAAFNRRSGEYLHYPNRQGIAGSSWGKVAGIADDPAGRLWLASPGGLMRFDPRDQRYTYFDPDPLNPQGISHSGITTLIRDQRGAIWIGTSGYGVDIYDPQANRFNIFRGNRSTSSRPGNFTIRSLFEDHEGNIWIGSDVLYRWNRRSGELRSFESKSGNLDELGSTATWSIIQDHRGDLWFGTYRGLYRYHPADGVQRHFQFVSGNSSGLQEECIYGVFEDREGTIWAVSERYLHRLDDPRRGIFRAYRFGENPPTNEPMSPSLYQDTDGDLWFATNQGLFRFQPTAEAFTSFHNDPGDASSLSHNMIRAITPDPQQPERYLWIGTAGGGLNRLDRETLTFEHFTTKDGLPNNVVYAVLPDAAGNLWMSTNRGLSRFDPHSRRFDNFDVNDGLQSNEFNTSAFYESASGELFFGGINGFNYFYPQEIKIDSDAPEIVFTDLKLFNQTVSPHDSNSVLSKVISRTEAITIPQRDNVISFEFAALDFTAPAKNRYAYKLEGFNQDWIQLGTRRIVTFTNLDPGEYVLRVKGSNSSGVWNEQGAILKITITPPLWRTWWAYTLYFLAFLGIILAIRGYEVNRIQLKNRLELEQIESNSLRQLDQVKSRFFANISHEFRTPLTLILGPIEQLIPEQPSESAKHTLQTMQRNAAQLLKLINQLLDLSKLDAGKMALQALRTDLIPYLKGIIMSYESMAEIRHIQLSFNAPCDALEMSFDPDKIEKIFHNLLSNAFKFTPDGGKISLQLSLSSDQTAGEKLTTGNCLLVTVSDSGIGIAPERLGHIFDRFYQVDDSPLREQGGTGIGLALVKELVELHGGSISAESEPGMGSTFTVRLPLGEAVGSDQLSVISDQDIEEQNLQTADPASDIQHPASSIQDLILVVEDNADVRAYIRQYLQADYQIQEARDGEEGLKIAQETVPDLVLSDLMMPKLDGYELCNALKTDPRTSHIPVILLTARAAQEDKLAGLETGADDYLTKPFDSRELQVRIKNLIELRKQLRRQFNPALPLRTDEIGFTAADRAFLDRIVQTVEIRLDQETFGVAELCKAVAMSERQLRRKIKALTDQSPNFFIRSLRLQRARQLLEQNAGSVSDVCYMVGFSNLAYFTKCFREQFGKPPSKFVNPS